jgi:dTDP-4-dehydrorhamnose reductase
MLIDRPDFIVLRDQVGAPTYAADLAKCMMHIVAGDHSKTINWVPGIYHYSNQGRISWHEFAVAIKELTGSACTVNPIPSEQYPTPAKRPAFSLLDTNKIRNTFKCTIPEWKDSLRECIKLLS